MSPHAFHLPAPAKLNLFLHILGQRPDGYHELQTVFQFLSHADQLHFSPRSDSAIHLSPPLTGIAPDDNLIVKAARLLQARTGCPQGADIHLEKVLPMGGGVGGGSSDAATTLLGLNHLWSLGLDLSQLAEIGLALGADVPVFVQGQAAFAEGVGERLTPVLLPEPWFLVLNPAVQVNTAQIFRHPELTRHTPAIKVAAFLGGGGQFPLRNDCENIVRSLFPRVDAALTWLAQHGSAKMTGTGSCCFIECSSRQQAERLLAESPVAGFVAKGCNRSPAHDALAAIQSQRI